MNKQQGGKEKKNVTASFSNGAGRNSIFGSYNEVEMLAQLKGLVVDPCSPRFARSNIQPLCNQILRIRKVMMLEDSEIPWRKRKLEQFVKDKLRSPPQCPLPNQQNVTKLSRGLLSHASSVSCLLNSVDSTQCLDRKNIIGSRTSSSLMTFEGALPDIPVSTKCSFLDDMVVLTCPLEDISPAVDSDESVNGSNPLSPVSPTPNEAPSLEFSDAVQYLGTATMDGKRRKNPMKSPRLSVRLLNFIGDHLQRKVVPVGPRFQADVPEWSGQVDRSNIIDAYKSDFGNSKWLGFTIWPIEFGSKMKTTGMRIGKGRLTSCCCKSSGSADCVRCHILEKRLILQSELGPTFFTWKFDEMGEQVSNSWSLKEQKSFESLLKKKPSSDGRIFLKRALKYFRNKSWRDIVNYYFNVYILSRMNLQTRSLSIEQIDTDDEDGTGDFNYMGVQKRFEGRSPIMCNSKAVKDRYLHGGSKK